ncbi:nucleotide sugar dehydrogenase [Nocardia sp. NPDC088792]|uniref:nucleotide sugar dehydrogenase n=1 Tax=Nocardia sp. NPDC088792 TaxID=3364332 RepID=UPI0038292756
MTSVQSADTPGTTLARRRRRVVVLGQGFVGLPAAMLAVEAGHDVVGYDTDTRRVTQLENAVSYVSDVSSECIAAALRSGHYFPTSDPDALKDFDVALIAVPTPLADNEPDLGCIEAAAITLSSYVRRGCLVILESTAYPGTTEDIVAPLLTHSGLKPGRDFSLGYAPERLNPGAGFAELAKVPKIVAGVDHESRQAVSDFWSELVSTVVPARTIRTAEVAKLVENAFRLVNISFVNELATRMQSLGVSVWEVLDLASTKPYGYMGFHPGAGAGGHCVPIDSAYLAWSLRRVSRPSASIETAIQINQRQPRYVTSRIISGILRRNHTTTASRSRIVVVGATYKPDIADIRDSAALKVVHELRRRGADVVIVDPLVPDLAHVLAELTPELIATASAVALLVDHECLDYELITSARYVFDACGALPPAANIERL